MMSAEAGTPPILSGLSTDSLDNRIDPNLIALSTLSLLNLRLSRLEYFLTGSSTPLKNAHRDLPANSHGSTPDIQKRLRELETRLAQLKRSDGVSGNLIRMLDQMRRQYPELFPHNRQSVEQDVPTPERELSTRASEVLSSSTLYTTTSAHLQTLQTLRTPSASLSANLINVRPRLQNLKERQVELDREIAQLKRRSATVVQWWMKTGVVGMGELWDDWEDRVTTCERSVRREERRRKEDG